MIKSERGSVTVFTLSACLLMSFILVGIFMGSQNKVINQKKQLKSIENSYKENSDDEKMAQLYEEKMKNDSNNIEADLKITTAEELKNFAEQVNSGTTFEGKTVVLMNDVDLASVCSSTMGSWTPIGTETNRFKGTFDGNYHIINNLYISLIESNCGFFRENEGTIKNLQIKDSFVETIGNEEVTLQNHGTIAAFNYGKIVNCSVINGSIRNGTHQSAILGGIVGVNSGEITNCCNGSSFDGFACIGGIASKNETEGIIENCYNTGKTSSTFADIGGIVDQNKGKVNNCYSTAILSPGYCNIGSVVGLNMGTVSNCYYLNSDVQGIGGEYSQSLGHSTSSDVKGQTEYKSEQQLKSLYETLGTAFKADYDTPINNGYPILSWQ